MVFLDGGVGHCGCLEVPVNLSGDGVAFFSVELTVDAGDDMVRIEVRDDDASLPGSGRVVSFELREASTAV